MKLHYRELGEGKPLMILHGLFGFSDNWQTHAKKLADYYRVILVDLRNHGHSDWSDEFSYKLMVEDVHELCAELKLEDFILVGHSMGGKVAMRFAQDYESLLEKMIVVDIGMKEYPMHHEHILAGIHAVNLDNAAARREADEQMSAHIESYGVKQFLLKNLYWKEKGQLAWRMNVAILEKEMPEILSAMPEKEVMLPSLFIRGALSNYILDEDIDALENNFPDSEVITIENAGHWVHAEAPDAFSEALLSFCLR
ncbi:MAG: alpha/beta fold hydrolase [Crocinitomicaceae bacterium]|nr:alpha/beta fold hydrolase [Crocinitomicaceae bacterium]